MQQDIYDSFGFLLAKAHQKLMATLLPLLEEEDVTPKQLGLLLVVESEPGITQKEAGAVQQIDRTSMTHQVDLLEKRGLLVRQPQENDRRAYGLRLTEAGVRMVGVLWRHIHQAQSRLFEKLDQEQVARLKELLVSIILE